MKGPVIDDRDDARDVAEGQGELEGDDFDDELEGDDVDDELEGDDFDDDGLDDERERSDAS